MSYGGVARQCGRPGMARAVGYALHTLPDTKRVPWWRVVNSHGRISIPDPHAAVVQSDLLRGEGVAVDERLQLDIRSYDAEGLVYKKMHRAHRKAR